MFRQLAQPLIEILMKADKVPVVFERIEGDKIRVTTSSWDDAKMILRKQVLEAAMIGKGRLGWSGSTSRSLTWTSTIGLVEAGGNPETK